MVRASTSALVLLMAVSVGGCTITTGGPPPRRSSYDYQSPARRPSTHGGQQSPKPSKPSSKPANPSTNPTPPPAPKPNPGTRGEVDIHRAPRVNAAFAFGDGDGGAFRGLAYALPQNTAKLPDFGKMKPFAEMFLDKFEVTPRDFNTGFPGVSRQTEWFGIRYDGDIRLPADGAYTFRLVSDDGAILYIDGIQLVNNDGIHASQSVSGTRNLRAGKHSMRVDYFHATGSVSLMVFVEVNGKESVLVGALR